MAFAKPQFPGTVRVDDERRVTHLQAPLPKLEAALITVAGQQDGDEVGLRVAAALEQVAEELHHWM